VLRILTRLWSEDSSTPVSNEGQKQQRGKNQSKTNKKDNSQKRAKATQNKGKRGEGASVEKPDTSLARQFKHLNRKHREPTTQKPRTQETRNNSTTEAAPKAVKEKSDPRGERTGQEKLEALTVFSQRIQAREKKGDREGKRGSRPQEEPNKQREGGETKRKGGVVERGAGSPGTSLARKTRSQMERRKKESSEMRKDMRGPIVE